MVLSSKREGNLVEAAVKGRFQDQYDIKLILDKDIVKAECSCPLEEEWCKHAVCVGLDAIQKNYHYDYLLEHELVSQEEEQTPDYQGAYKFMYNSSLKPKVFSLKIIDRKTAEAVNDIEGLLRAVIALQKDENTKFELNEAQKYEFAMMQFMLKNGTYNKNSGYYELPFNKLDEIIKYFSKLEEVIDETTNEKIEVQNSPWKLVLSVNVSLVGNVMLSLHWITPDEDDIFPTEEVKLFSRHFKWGRRKNKIFPLDTAIGKLPHHLLKSSFTDIRDADGGKFVYEELPHLKKLTTVDISEKLDKLTLEEKLPQIILAGELTDEQNIKIALEFDYDGTRVPYGKIADKTPYVTVKKPEEDLIYWVKRKPSFEQQAYQMLVQHKFIPMQTNNLLIENDYAIDFYSFIKPNLPEHWVFEEKNDFSPIQVFKNPLTINAKIDFNDSVDSFSVKLTFTVGKETIPIESIQAHIQQGKKYIETEKSGFAEIPMAKIMQLNKGLSNVDAELNEESSYSIKTFRVGFVNELTDLGADLKMSAAFKKFWNKITTFSTQEDVPLPKKLNAELREYQKKGFNWLWFLYTYGLNGILADDMGLGKTLQALTLIQKAKEADKKKPSLVICPTSVVFNWEDEIAKFTPGLKCLNLTGAARKDQFEHIEKYDVIVTSYALVRRDVDILKSNDFRFIILDEAQNIKNFESVTAQCAKSLKSDHRLALSGTPIENKLSELWSLFDFLMPGFMYDINEFNFRYAVPIQDKGDKLSESRLKKQISPYILRRMKRNIAKDLPDKVENVAYCQMTPEQKDFYIDVLDSTREEIFGKINNDGFEKSRMSIFAALLRLRQICNHPRLFDKENIRKIKESGKFEHLKTMLEEIISEGHRILLFSQFVQMLDIIKEYLEEKGIRYEYLTGDTKDRGDRVKNFNNDETIPIFLISLKAGGTGLNLTGADYVIHYDPWWNPAVEDQATDRAHRIGQTKKVFVYRLITKGTVEEKIMKLKERKRDLADTIISADRSIEKNLTLDDIKDIFSLEP